MANLIAFQLNASNFFSFNVNFVFWLYSVRLILVQYEGISDSAVIYDTLELWLQLLELLNVTGVGVTTPDVKRRIDKCEYYNH